MSDESDFKLARDQHQLACATVRSMFAELTKRGVPRDIFASVLVQGAAEMQVHHHGSKEDFVAFCAAMFDAVSAKNGQQ